MSRINLGRIAKTSILFVLLLVQSACSPVDFSGAAAPATTQVASQTDNTTSDNSQTSEDSDPAPQPQVFPVQGLGCVPVAMQNCDGAGQLASRAAACWGWWDNGSMGDGLRDCDPRMCTVTGVSNGNFNTPQTGCMISASKCLSGQAVAVSVTEPNDGCLIRKWIYECL